MRLSRAEREAEEQAIREANQRRYEEELHAARTTGAYHLFGIESVMSTSVCHRCSAVVIDQDQHTAWHASMGQEMPS